MTKVPQPLKWAGGKRYLADWIIGHFPKHRNYVEPFAGGLAVLLAKEPEGVSEVVNDLSDHLTNFWCVLRDDHQFGHFRRLCEATPFSEYEWQRAERILTADWGDYSDVEIAHAFLVCCRQSLAGRMDAFASVSTGRVRRGMNEQVSAWLTAVEGLPAVHNRLKRVLVLNKDAADVIRQFDKPETVIYCDPPYYPDTRTSPDVYDHEMTPQQHEEFLEAVLSVKDAFVAVSGYHCGLYDRLLKDWKVAEKEVANHASGTKSKRKMTEVLWMNY